MTDHVARSLEYFLESFGFPLEKVLKTFENAHLWRDKPRLDFLYEDKTDIILNILFV